MSTKVKLTEIRDCMNEAPTGGFVGIVDYVSGDDKVMSITGRLGCSYAKAKEIAISELKDAIEIEDFENITVKGSCYWDTVKKEWNARKKSMPLWEYDETFTDAEVLEIAKGILHDWENPKKRANNKVQLTDKENGLSFNTETCSFNFNLMVDHCIYKEEATAKLQEGKEQKVKCSMPEMQVKKLVRERFEKKIKAFTISEGKFETLKVGGQVFRSDSIRF